nr:MAG TPA: hypothetical protein [Caudoviricetes sp.]
MYSKLYSDLTTSNLLILLISHTSNKIAQWGEISVHFSQGEVQPLGIRKGTRPKWQTVMSLMNQYNFTILVYHVC